MSSSFCFLRSVSPQQVGGGAGVHVRGCGLSSSPGKLSGRACSPARGQCCCLKGTDRTPQEKKGTLGKAGILGNSEGLGRLPWPQGNFRAGSARRAGDSDGHECQDQGLWLPFRWWGVAETCHLWAPVWGGSRGPQGTQAALPIAAYHCKAVEEASAGLAGVKLPTLQFQPDQLCCETRAGRGGRKPEEPHVFSSKAG